MSDDSEDPAEVTVSVEDIDGAAIGGVGIVISDGDEVVRTGTTDVDGGVTVELAAGTYDMEASKDGYYTETRTDFKITSGETTSIAITLEAKPAILELVVYNGNDEPIGGAGVAIYDNGTVITTGMTDDTGCFNAELETGVYDVEVSKDGYSTSTEIDVEMQRGETTAVSIILKEESAEASELTVQVTDEESSDIENATVGVEAEDGELIESGETDSMGHVTFGLDPDNYTVYAEKAGYNSTATTVELEAGGETTVLLTLESNAPELAVQTVSVDGITPTDATLHGELVTIDGVDDAATYFEFRAVGASSWQSTTRTIRTSDGSFAEGVSGLKTDTDYEFRAVAENDDANLRETGTVLSFKTEKSAARPEIEQLTVTEVSPPNPHADIEVGWDVTHRDGLLDTVLIHIQAIDGSATETERTSVSGEAASGVNTVRMKKGANTTYQVTLTVIDTNNEHVSNAETVSA